MEKFRGAVTRLGISVGFPNHQKTSGKNKIKKKNIGKNLICDLFSLSRPGPWEDKSLNLIFPTNHVIPEGLKFSHWLSKYQNLGQNSPGPTKKKSQVMWSLSLAPLFVQHTLPAELIKHLPVGFLCILHQVGKPNLRWRCLTFSWGNQHLEVCINVKLGVCRSPSDNPFLDADFFGIVDHHPSQSPPTMKHPRIKNENFPLHPVLHTSQVPEHNVSIIFWEPQTRSWSCAALILGQLHKKMSVQTMSYLPCSNGWSMAI